MHAGILARKDYALDVSGLQSIQTYLSPKLKQEFYHHEAYQTVFQDANQLNQAFLLVADMVTCYRAELGGMLRKLVEGYNSVIL